MDQRLKKLILAQLFSKHHVCSC